MPIVEFDGPPFWFLDSRETGKTLSKNCLLLGTDNVRGQNHSTFSRQTDGIVHIYYDYQSSNGRPNFITRRGEQHTSAGRGRLSLPNLAGFHGK